MSGVAHPTKLGLLFVSERQDALTIVGLEPRGDAAVTLGAVGGMLAATLSVSMAVLGRPKADVIERGLDEVLALLAE